MAIDTSDLTIVAHADALTEGGGTWTGGSPDVDTELFREATGSISSTQRKASGFPGLTPGISWVKASSPWIDLSNKVLYLWMNHSALAYLDTKQNGGIRIWLQDSSSRNAYFYVDGKDTYFGGFKCYCLDCDKTPSSADSGFDKANIKSIGFIMQVTGAAKNAANTWCDIIRYTDKTTGGVTIYGGNAGAPMTFQELVNDEISTADGKAYGIVRPSGGVVFVRGRIKIGMTSGTTSTYFKDTTQVVIWEDMTYYLPGTGLVSMLSTACNGILPQGVSGTYPTTLYFGSSSGSGDSKVGISGCFFKAAGTAQFGISFTSANVTVLGVYGCSFLSAASITFPAYSVDKDVLNCSFEGCGEVTADTCTIKNCNFISSPSTTTGAIMINSTSHHTSKCNFIGCSRGVRFPSGSQGNYTFESMMFTGCTVDIRNEVASGQTVQITCTGTPKSNPVTHEEPNGGTTTIISGITLTITCKDTNQNNIQSVRCAIYKQSDMTEYMNKLTDASGVAQESMNDPGTTNIYVRIRKSSTLQVVTMQSGGYVDCVSSDIGKQVRDAAETVYGTLFNYDNSTRKWWVYGTTQLPTATAYHIETGSGQGTSSSASTTDTRYKPIDTIGTISGGYTLTAVMYVDDVAS